ncbi:MAG: DJ-1/PfpI family protein [Prolixibacteraceae bacterium]|nr:DJ-1/PfpI family protein [Prolixibacteraceae bacterium]
MKKILVHLANGFEEMEAIIPIDVWRRAGYAVHTVSLEEGLAVNGAHNISIIADWLFCEAVYDDADMIFLPGGMPGAANLNAHKGLKEKINQFYMQGKYLSAICAAPLVLGHSGLLEGKKATCYPGFEKELFGAKVTGNPVEQDGKIVTGKGPGAAFELALKVVTVFSGEEKASELAAKMQLS